MTSEDDAEESSDRAPDVGDELQFDKLRKPANTWTVEDVSHWLTKVGLEEVKDRFVRCDVNGELLIYLTKEELEEVLDIDEEFTRKAILRLTKELRAAHEVLPLDVAEEKLISSSPVLEEALTLTFGLNRGIIDAAAAISLLTHELQTESPMQKDKLQFLLAYLLWERGDRKPDSQDIIRCKQLLEESKDPLCVFYLARCLKEEKEETKAIEYFTLAYSYIKTLSETELDDDLWVVWMRAYMDGEGFGTYKNENAALQGYRHCATGGHALGQFSLGLAYSNGKGVPKDLPTAVDWYTKASKQGLAVAMCNLGNLYYGGEGMQKDMEESFRWYTRAAKAGHKPSQTWLTSNSRTW